MNLESTVNGLEIDLMDWKDAYEVARLEVGIHSTPWSRSAFEQEVRDFKSCYYLVARVEDLIIGYAGQRFVADEAHITTVSVHDDFRNHGVGTQLLKALLVEARSRQAGWVTLEVRQSNSGAQRLYERFGFKIVGRRVHYYAHPREDALIMTLNTI